MDPLSMLVQQEKEKKSGSSTSSGPPGQPLQTYLNSSISSKDDPLRTPSKPIPTPLIHPSLLSAPAPSALEHPLSPRKPAAATLAVPSSSTSLPHPLSPLEKPALPSSASAEKPLTSFTSASSNPSQPPIASQQHPPSAQSTPQRSPAPVAAVAPSAMATSRPVQPSASAASTSQTLPPRLSTTTPAFPFPTPSLPQPSTSPFGTPTPFTSASAAYSAASAYSAAAGVAPPSLPPTGLSAPSTTTGVPSPSSMSRLESTNARERERQERERERERQEEIAEQLKVDTELHRIFNGPPPLTILLEASSVPQNEKGIIQLCEAGRWREVIRLCETLLQLKNGEPISPSTVPDSPTSPRSPGMSSSSTVPPHLALRYNSYLLSALLKLRMFDAAQTTLTRIGPFFSPEKQFESYPQLYGSRRGNMVPFNLHLLRCELAHYQGQTKQTIDLLFSVRSYVKGQIARAKAASSSTTNTGAGAAAAAADGVPTEEDDASRPLAPSRGNSTLSTTPPPHAATLPLPILYSRLKRIQLKLSNYYLLLPEPDYPTAITLLKQAIDDCYGSRDYALLGYLGRLCMQAGDVTQGKHWFTECEKGWRSIGVDDHIDCSLHKAILAIQAGEYSAASMILQAAVLRHSMGDTSHPTAMLNNAAVTLLYSNQIAEGISVIEDYIKVAPAERVEENLINNLKCLYDLRFVDSTSKKKAADHLASTYDKRLL